jgi:molybdopterin converting factor subunit 1
VNVCVRLFAVAKELAGTDTVSVEVSPAATVAELRRVLAQQFPALAELLPHVMLSVNAQYASDATRIPPDAEVACIPPVSGG